MFISRSFLLSCAAALLCAFSVLPAWGDEGTPAAGTPTDQIRVRDPFILAEDGVYYLYIQSGNRKNSGYRGVEVRTSDDLEHWSDPRPVLKLDDPGVINVWAPEVHRYNGAYYLFVTLTFKEILPGERPSENWPPLHRRGTWCFKADRPDGPFVAVKDGSITPEQWLALDGTLWVEDDIPYMVFCHEWVQVIDGTIDYMPLADDLSGATAEPQTILRASQAPGENHGNVTDGPFLYKSEKSSALFMLWSNFLGEGGYSVLAACSPSGRLCGPWNESVPIYTHDGGHAMIFRDFRGALRVALHQPNVNPQERLLILKLVDDGKSLRLEE